MTVAVACAASGQSMSSSVRTSAEIRSLRIVPRSASVCPGKSIDVRYEAVTSTGARVLLGPAEMSRLERSASAARANADGTWHANPDPLESLMTGIRLHAALVSDTSIRADTTIAPDYDCLGPFSVKVASGSAYVRLGVLRTPFHDSVVVAAIERDGDATLVVLGPGQMRSGAIRIDAGGRAGTAGRAGMRGQDGGACENGERGSDGEEGGPGTPGGRVDMIVQEDAPWLERLVSITNPGGKGGPGGAGGLGGNAGSRSSGSTRCSTQPGPFGRPGRAGQDGLPGPTPRVTTIPFALIWPGSPTWNNPASRDVLSAAMDYTSKS